MATNKKIKKDSQTFPATDLPAYYSQVLEKWTKLVNLEGYNEVEQLVGIHGRPEYRMEIEDTLVSLEMLSSQGTNSFVYLVKTYGYTNEAILKHFKTSEGIQSNSTESKSNSTESKSSETIPIKYYTQPKLEAKLQKYAHAHSLAPEVFAFNDVAMISDKCFDVKYKIQKCYIATYGKNTWKMLTAEMSKLKRADSVLQEWFNPFTDQILNLVDTMYEEIGMYNMDPNGGNYMLNQTGTLIQIDYGANRFDKQEAFDTFANRFDNFANGFDKVIYFLLQKELLLKDQPTYPPYYYRFRQKLGEGTILPELMKLPTMTKLKGMDGFDKVIYFLLQKELLLEDQPTYPPYYYWFRQKLGEGTILPELIKLPTKTKLKGMDKREWQKFLSGLRTQKNKICDKIKALQKKPTTTTTKATTTEAIFRTHIKEVK